MRVRIVATVLALGLWGHAVSSAATPDLTGDWVGVVSEAAPFSLILHVDDEVRLDSPDRGAFGILGEARQSGDHVKIVFANGSAFDGALVGNRLVGDYLRGPAQLPLTFERKPSGRVAPRLEIPTSR